MSPSPGSGMYTIIGLGEVLWDIFEDGKVLGGAPCNFAYHVSALGHVGLPLTRVGEDELGREIVSVLQKLGLRTDSVQLDPSHPTGRVLVQLDRKGVPDFTIIENVAWDCMSADKSWLEAARGADAVCFGTLAQRTRTSRAAIRKVLAAAEGVVRVFDVNFRQQFFTRRIVVDSLKRTTILKLNEDEVRRMQELLGAGGKEEEFVRATMEEYGIRLACVTRGERGCTLYAGDGTVSRLVPPTQVKDTVGSGDAFTAGLVIKYLDGRPLEAVADGANLLGAYVAGCRGATPPVPAEVVSKFYLL